MEGVTNVAGVINFTGQQVRTVTKINKFVVEFADKVYVYKPIALAMLGVKTYITTPILVAFSGLLLFLSTVLVKPFYFKIAMAQIETGVSAKAQPKKFKKESIMQSLIKKEFLVTFRTPGYIFQYFIFVLLMPFIVLVYDKLLITVTVSRAGKVMICGAHLLVLSILTMLSCSVSASAISREGGNYYIMKTSPVTFKKQTVAKVLFNVIIVFIAVLCTTITSLIFIDMNSMHLIMSSIAAFIASIGMICWNFDMDLRSPSLDWYDSGEITTLSKNTGYSIFIGLIVSFVLSFLVFLFVNLSFIWILLVIMSIAFALYRIQLLNLRINYYFKKNEI
jgi:ABC-2 type transport system permease protein